jgi:hypothetical protein
MTMVLIYTKTQIHIAFSILMALTIFFASASFILAQTHAQNRLLLTITPELPRPNEEVTASIRYYLSDLDRAIINWYINGELRASGPGLDSFTFNSEGLGKRVTLFVSATTLEGKSLSSTYSVVPNNVELLWEAKTHVPPTYVGRALPSGGSTLRVVAFPDFKMPGGINIPAENLFYEWSINNKRVSSASGQGKNILETVVNSFTKDTNISVVVTNNERSLAAKKEITIPTYTPLVLVYKDDALAGPIYENAIIDNFVITGSEVSLVAEPYYIKQYESLKDIVFWELNKKDARADVNNERRLTLVKEEGAISGRASLIVKLFNPGSVFEVARRVISVWF